MARPSRLQQVPDVIYGTAFKFDQTAALVETALRVGFKAVDTSGNKPQYDEAAVGRGVAAAIESRVLKRSDVFIQTKFSPYKPGKDPALYPYDVALPIEKQVDDSIASSLTSLKVEYIDCLILHSLYADISDTLAAWRAMERFVPHKVSSLGLSNVDHESLSHIYEFARVKPSSIQNRFTGDTAPRPDAKLPPGLPYPKVPYDRDVRQFCSQNNITYTPWGLLWGNSVIMDHLPVLDQAARDLGISKQAVMYAYMRQLGCAVLCGTTKEDTMHKTLDGLAKVEDCRQAGDHQEVWEKLIKEIECIISAN